MSSHKKLLVEADSTGVEVFFFTVGNDVDNGSYIEKIDTYGADLTDTDTVKTVLRESTGKASGRADKVTSTFYFEGDYTKTLEAVRNDIEFGEKYNLINNNCVQKTINAFCASDSRFSLVCSGNGYLIPNDAATKVAMLPSKKGKTPWRLYIHNFFEYFSAF